MRKFSNILNRHQTPELGGKRDITQISSDEVALFQTFYRRPKFFVFGHARSGTTLLARLVRLHPDVHCNWQGRFFTHPFDIYELLTGSSVSSWFNHRSNQWNRRIETDAALVRAVVEYILEAEAERVGKYVVGDKTPNLQGGFAVKKLHKVFPDACLLNIVRDGRDVLVSSRIADFVNRPHELSRFDKRIRRDFIKNFQPYCSKEKSIFGVDWVESASERWADHVTETHRLGQQLFIDRYFSLRYEDLLKEPQKWMSRVWEKLGVDPNAVPSAAINSEMEVNPNIEYRQHVLKKNLDDLQLGKPDAWRILLWGKYLQTYTNFANIAMKDWGYDS